MVSKKIMIVVLLGLIFGLTGCGSGQTAGLSSSANAMPASLTPASLSSGQKLKVVATTTIVGDLVAHIGADAITLYVMLPVGADPHGFEPTPQDVAAVSDADVIFENGLGLEGFLTSVIKNSGTKAPLVPLAEGVDLRQLAAQDSHEHADGGTDPHIWTTPVNAQIMVKNIVDALVKLDPANAQTYQANASAYRQQLAALDEWVKSQVAQIPPENRKLVTDHAIFGYFAERYGFEQIGTVIPSFSTNAEPSAQELAQLEEAVRAQGVKAIFVGNTVNPTLTDRVAEDTGVKLVRLYTGSLGPAGSGAETYLDYIRTDTEAIVKALQ